MRVGAEHLHRRIRIDRAQLTPAQIFDVLAINVDGPRAWDLDLAVDVTFGDTADNYRVTLRNGVLVYRKRAAKPDTAQATVTVANGIRLLALATGDRDSPGLQVSGDAGVLSTIVGVLDRPDPGFDIITP